MKASTGIDYAEFFLFLHLIATQRLNLVKKSSKSKSDVDGCNTSSKQLKDKEICQPDKIESSCNQECEQPRADSVPSGNHRTFIEDHIDRVHEQQGTQTTASETTSSESELSLAKEHFQNSASKSSPAPNKTDSFHQSIKHGANVTVWHAVFDLQRISTVLESLMNNKEFQELDSTILCDNPKNLFGKICEVLEDFL